MHKPGTPDDSDGLDGPDGPGEPGGPGEPVFVSTALTSWQDRARAALTDLRQGLDLYQSWIYLALADTRHSSRRTRIGPLWHTLGFALMIFFVGYIWSRMSSMGPDRFFRYFASGFFMFQYLSTVAVGGFGCFIYGGGYVSNSALPVSFFLFWHYTRMLFVLALQLPVMIVVFVVFGGNSDPRIIEAVVAFLAVVVVCVTFGFSMGLLFTRYRDLLEVSRNSLRLFFILTPIIWAPEDMFTRFEKITGTEPSFWLPLFTIWLNPVYHMIEVFRAPMLGSPFPVWSWVFIAGAQVVATILFFVFYARYRSRIVFWV